MIKVYKKKIENLLILNTKTYRDKRGYFREIFKEKLIKKRFPFQVMSFSKKKCNKRITFTKKKISR
jgi:dTDP-4-dehydrorhamnose 3,5-epimerase